MDIAEAKKTLKTMKENIDKKYLKTRNSVAIDTVLSELEKKDTEIEQLKSMELKAKYGIASITLEGLINLENEIKKRDKIIDEMAKYINNFDIDEDICKKVDEPCKNYAGENGKLCNECIIDYFTKKVEGK